MTAPSVPEAEPSLSPATWLATKVFGALRYLSFWEILRVLFARRNPVFKFRGDFTPTEVANVELSVRRSRAVDIYVLFWTLGSALALGLVGRVWSSSGWRAAFYILAAVRLVELIQSPLNTMVFDFHRGRVDANTASSSRLLVLVLLNTVEFAIWFAVLYAMNLSLLKEANGVVDALYFSVMTQFTVGYGDVYPTGLLRPLAILQVGGGFLLAVIVLA